MIFFIVYHLTASFPASPIYYGFSGEYYINLKIFSKNYTIFRARLLAAGSLKVKQKLLSTFSKRWWVLEECRNLIHKSTFSEASTPFAREKESQTNCIYKLSLKSSPWEVFGDRLSLL